MGQDQHNLEPPDSSSSGRRLGLRVCLRRYCGQTYQASRWNQRYCQDPECLREVRRWQASKRQREHRRIPENRQRHAAAEVQRRKRRKESATGTCRNAEDDCAMRCNSCAWSRSKKNSSCFCDRPGCYDPPQTTGRTPARYCSDDCRQAMRRVPKAGI